MRLNYITKWRHSSDTSDPATLNNFNEMKYKTFTPSNLPLKILDAEKRINASGQAIPQCY